MKAIILAAGQGTRLMPLTSDRPKCLVEYRGKPLLEYTLENFKKCGVDEVIVVGGHCYEKLEPYKVKRYLNSAFQSSNMVVSLFCAEQELDQDIIVSYGDIVYEQEVLEALIEAQDPLAVVVDLEWEKLWRQRMADPLSDAETLKINRGGFIMELGKKPQSLQDVQGQYIGLFKIKREALPALREFYHSLNPRQFYDGKDFANMYMTSFLQLIIDRLMPIKAVPVRGGWIEIDSVSDLNCSMISV